MCVDVVAIAVGEIVEAAEFAELFAEEGMGRGGPSPNSDRRVCGPRRVEGRSNGFPFLLPAIFSG